MKYIARPVQVEAFRIQEVCPQWKSESDGSVLLLLERQRTQIATMEMLSRIAPKPGDYVVIQQDGYVYLNPAEVFERKYRPLTWFDRLRRFLRF